MSEFDMDSLTPMLFPPMGRLCPQCGAELLDSYPMNYREFYEVWCPECGLHAEGKDLDEVYQKISAR